MKKSDVKALRCFTPVIKNGKFAFNHTLESVEMLFSVKKIEHSAFSGCPNLKEIIFSKKLKSIGDSAFSNCTSLEEIVIPSSVQSLGASVFKDCKNLKTVLLSESLKTIPQKAFENCVSLEKITLPDSIEVIEEGAFSGCVNLREITFSKKLTTIENKAFKRCYNLNSVIFPETLNYIGDKCFELCKNLSSVVFNSELRYIGAAVFPETPCVMPQITGTMFSSSFIQKSEYPLCPTVTVPDGIKTLALGFENTLNYKRRNAEKTCYAHIISLDGQKTKVFISEYYYSYDNRNDYIIENGKFDYEKYDKQFGSADEHEKSIIALLRLTYPKELKPKTKVLYETELKEKVFDAAMFAVEKNEEDALRYIVENCTLSTEDYTSLYETAAKNKFGNLQQILTQKKEKTGFEEIESFFSDIG